MSACDLIIGALIVVMVCCLIKMLALTDRGSAFVYDEIYVPLSELCLKRQARAHMLETRGETETLAYAMLKVKIAMTSLAISIVEVMS